MPRSSRYSFAALEFTAANLKTIAPTFWILAEGWKTVKLADFSTSLSALFGDGTVAAAIRSSREELGDPTALVRRARHRSIRAR
jgi:hypothetical protein